MKFYRIKDYAKYKRNSYVSNLDFVDYGLEELAETSTCPELDVSDLVKLEGKVYFVRSIVNGLYVVLEPFDFFAETKEDIVSNEEANYAEERIICPVCGYEDPDSFEVTEYEPEWECPQCGSILEVEPNHHVTYNVHFKRLNKSIVEI